MVNVVLSQLMCLYQFLRVIGCSVMCGFFRSYLELRRGLYSVVPSGKAAACSETVDEDAMLGRTTIKSTLVQKKSED